MTENNKNYRPVFAPPRDVVTGNQINHLLATAKVIMDCLAHIDAGSEDYDTPKVARDDGGCLAAAEATFMNTCHRLDTLLEDASRWDMKGQDTLEEDLSQLFKHQSQAAQMHAVAAARALTPAVQYGALIYKISSEAWVAYSGDLTNERDSIVAVGISPEDAFASFNKVCLGQMSERTHQTLLNELLSQLEIDRKQLNERKPLDGRSGQSATKIEGQRVEPKETGEDSGPDKKSGSAEIRADQLPPSC